MVKIFHKATIKDLVGTWQYNQTDGELISYGRRKDIAIACYVRYRNSRKPTFSN